MLSLHPVLRSIRAAGLAALTALCFLPAPAGAADDVFIYSSASQIRGLNLTRQTDRLLTTSPIAAAANALAVNSLAGFVYYGDGTSVYRWDPAMGSGAAAHALMMNFATGPVLAPITELNSTAGSYLDGTYYVGSEATDGTIDELWALTMSLDGSQVVSAQALGLLAACNCTSADLGGFGDIAALQEGGTTVLFGSSSAIGTGGSLAGRWRFTPSTGQFQFLASAQNGQMSSSLSGQLYSNVGNQIRRVDPATGATDGTTLFTTSQSIFDFTSGFELDFGDAPDSYGAAFHRIGGPAQVRIGALGPDNDPGTLNAVTGLANGAGDDTEGIDDEDAVTSAAAVSVLSGSYSLSVACSAGSRVAGWIDLDRDGEFDDSERNGNHPASCSAGVAQLQWSSLAAGAGGASWLRLRASSNIAAISSPTGIASDGEVEDHPITIDAPLVGSCPAGSTGTVYTASDLPRAIGPDANTVTTSTIQVPAGAGTVTDVNVLGVQGSHTYINDLLFSLTQGGVTRNLYGYSCGSQNNFSFSFDDEASGTPPCAPTDGGSYPPSQSLSAFDGNSADGAWQLRINDRANADGGSLAGWSLEVCTVSAAPQIRLGKSATVVDRDVTLTFAVQNTGNVAVQDLQIDDALDGVFGAGNYTVVSAPVVTAGPAGSTANADFDGSDDTELLATGVALDVGERLDVVTTVRIDTLGGMPLGEYANSATASADAAGTAVSDVSNDGLDLSADGDAPTPIALLVRGSLSGQVFLDRGAAAAQAHDGVREPSDAGQGGAIIDLLDEAGNLLASTGSDGDGRWRIELDATQANNSVTVALRVPADRAVVSEAAAFRDAQPADGRVTFVPAAGADITGLDLGVVPVPVLQSDRSLSTAPGTSLQFAHRYDAPTHGSLDLQVSSSDTLQRRLLPDADCDDVADSSSATLGLPLMVVPDQVVCFLVEVFVPATAVAGTVHEHDVGATLTLSDAASTGHAVVMTRSNRDRVTVAARAQGRLVLEKRVRNVTRGEMPALGNAGLPGETLEYDIVYRNDGDAPLTELAIDDLTPAYSALVAGSVLCVTTPASLGCSPITGPTGLGWRFSGSLAPGDQGLVRYRVTID